MRLLLNYVGLDHQPALALLFDDPDGLRRCPHRPIGAQVQAFLGCDVRILAAAHIFPIENIRQRAFHIQNRLFKQFSVVVPERLRGSVVGHDDAQAFRLDQQEHLLRVVDKQSLQAAHFFIPSLFGVPASK